MQQEAEDNRTLREYLSDVEKTEAQGLYPQYSVNRKRILAFWTRAIDEGWVNLDDPIHVAVSKTREKTSQ